MAINFPNSPTVNDEFTSGGLTWIWDGTAWNLKPSSLTAEAVVDGTPPTSPNSGALWYDTNSGKTYVWYQDGSSNQWVEVGSAAITGGAAAYIRGGSDVIDGDRLTIDYVPTGYARNASASGAGDVTDLTAHLSGINFALGGGSALVTASGGTETVVTIDGVDYKLHTFTSTGNLIITTGGNIDVLIIAGGGGGGGSNTSITSSPGSGGGAGGLIYEKNFAISSGTFTATVGLGGNPGSGIANGTAGNNSSFSTLTAIGGGYGVHASTVQYGNDGGSGGGGMGASGGYPTPGQGHFGGNSVTVGSNTAGSGGGGAGEAGISGSTNYGGRGGTGRVIDITGTDVTYAGGGGGGHTVLTGSNAGLGGGGAGGTNSNGTAGTANTGGGGGGAGANGAGTARTGGAGGSGIIIVRYRV